MVAPTCTTRMSCGTPPPRWLLALHFTELPASYLLSRLVGLRHRSETLTIRLNYRLPKRSVHRSARQDDSVLSVRWSRARLLRRRVLTANTTATLRKHEHRSRPARRDGAVYCASAATAWHPPELSESLVLGHSAFYFYPSCHGGKCLRPRREMAQRHVYDGCRSGAQRSIQARTRASFSAEKTSLSRMISPSRYCAIISMCSASSSESPRV